MAFLAQGGGGVQLPWTRGFFSIAADFLPTFMYCLGSRDFEVAQTALRNLPEYTLLCQGQFAAPGGLSPPARSEDRQRLRPWEWLGCGGRADRPSSVRRARGRVAAPGLPGGHVWPDGHQCPDLRGPEDPALGGRDVSRASGPPRRATQCLEPTPRAPASSGGRPPQRPCRLRVLGAQPGGRALTSCGLWLRVGFK